MRFLLDESTDVRLAAHLRLSTTFIQQRIARLDAVLDHYGDQLDQFLVVTDQRVRVRRHPPNDRGAAPEPA